MCQIARVLVNHLNFSLSIALRLASLNTDLFKF